MDAKPYYTSKTFWTNLLFVVAALASSFGYDITPEIQSNVIMLMMGGANLYLRFKTDKPVRWK